MPRVHTAGATPSWSSYGYDLGGSVILSGGTGFKAYGANLLRPVRLQDR